MERSRRSAGVRLRLGAIMDHTLRSFVISLAIAIVINNSPASGFTIARSPQILDLTPDLETGESKLLEVRHDFETLNDNKTINNSKAIGEPDSTVITINDTKHTNKQNLSNEKDNEVQLIVNETADTQTKMSEDSKIEIPSDITAIILTETTSHSFTTSAPNTRKTSTTESERSQNLSTKSTARSAFVTESQINTFKKYSNDIIKKEPVKKEISESETRTTDTQNSSLSIKTPEDQNYKKDITSIAKPDTNNVSANVNNSEADKSGIKTNDLKNDINNLNDSTYSNVERKDTRNMFDSESKVKNETNFPDQKADQRKTKEESSITKTDGSLDVPTTASSESKTETTTENFTTESNTNIYPPAVPSWKKYTTIDRKRTSTEDTTTTEKDMMARAETAQTRISLEKVWTNTPIPSLEKLRNDLIKAQESLTTMLVTTNEIESNVSHTPDSATSTSTPKIDAEIETRTTKLEIVSKRAGYKDNRETTTSKPEEASTKSPFAVKMNNTDMHDATVETEVEVTDNKNDTVYESQSQLTEDAIKEELLIEETLNDNEENAKRQREELNLPGIKQGKIIDEFANVPRNVTNDTLSVKPIGNEKKKNTILYAVSPNYKPLKKIDVQPPKQFVRDPDDNSWRNESISSLGIVFKPKNASKSFTQVLKNKTETELGNMTDKDNKGDLPDLRVRLEKIAEVRKSKKKINKFGDTVYSDYEESGENANPSREDTTTPMIPSVESMPNFTPPPSSSTAEFDLMLNAITRDLVKNEETTPITTNKPEKFYNVAEYYDAIDEYDAEYVNQHKIDLKKFTKPLNTKESFATQPPELLRTQSMNQPERKATLQYFPPTQKVIQKVNTNNYDTDFNRKMILYNFDKAPPKNILDASFGTVSPIQTEKYEQITMKPAYTPMYQTDNLDKNLYLTNQPRMSEPPGGFVPNDGNFNRASYVIKHYRDFINEAAKEGEDERSEYSYTESPLHGVTINELAKIPPGDSNHGEEYDYDMKFRKDVMNRFIDNFNQNSDRFKVEFPILYNSSVVHRHPSENGRVASSTALMKRLYEVANPRPSNILQGSKRCEPPCDMTVELSPAYELHYYVPDEEEKEEVEPRSAHRYRL